MDMLRQWSPVGLFDSVANQLKRDPKSGNDRIRRLPSTMIEVAGGEVPEILDGTSLIKVLEGETKHKSYVFGDIRHGIINGSNHYAFDPSAPKNTNTSEFYSGREVSKCLYEVTRISKLDCCGQAGSFPCGGTRRRYQYRPEIELYDVEADPFEMNNLADQPGYDVKGYVCSWIDG